MSIACVRERAVRSRKATSQLYMERLRSFHALTYRCSEIDSTHEPRISRGRNAHAHDVLVSYTAHVQMTFENKAGASYS